MISFLLLTFGLLCSLFFIPWGVELGYQLGLDWLELGNFYPCWVRNIPVWLRPHQFSSVQLLSRVWLFVTPWTAACQASLSIANVQSLLKLLSIESVMPSNHLILCHPLLLPPSIFFPESGSFPISWLFASGGQSIGVSASISVLSMNIQDWFPLGLTSLISLQSKGLSRVFNSNTVWKHQLSGHQPSLWTNSPIDTWLLEKP